MEELKGEKLFIVGLGLIGGSLALALKEANPSVQIAGWDSNPFNRNRALELGLIESIEEFRSGVASSALSILSTPVNSIPTLLKEALDIYASISPSQRGVICDMGSTKVKIGESVREHPMREHYVAAHPIAGTEFSGPDAALSGLFKEKNMILCDLELSAPYLANRVEELFREIGMRVRRMNSRDHDYHVAYVSHLSHISAFSLAISVLDKEEGEKEILNLAAGGFDSTVRLAKSSSETWSAILLHNREYLLEAIESYSRNIEAIRVALERGEGESLKEIIVKANKIKKILN
ncbi:MAG: prephenate dehydrogenase [Bacteroidales bacterium]